ncbi:MAG: 1-(5-phosphoribosyl)-5-[(5-phosphoribosylamino)methylideneamino]imidazole-4-carboxamide isomerase [Pseudomonadota bacterium]
MILYPAIDLKGGHCVRLSQGQMECATFYEKSPSKQALRFQKAGCGWLHIVDLDGAFKGQAVNQKAVLSILESVDLPIQLGGGIRDLASIEKWLNCGIKRVILGTIAVHDPKLVEQACKAFPGSIAVGIDALNGLVAIKGWKTKTDLDAHQLAIRFGDCGINAIIHTDIARDGMLKGPNLKATQSIAFDMRERHFETEIIASGGVSSMDDLRALTRFEPISGIVVGRALYEKRFRLEDALQILNPITQDTQEQNVIK